MPFLLDSSVEEVYRDHNWLPSMVNRPDLGFTYPTLSELYDKVADKLEHTDYEAEIKGNLKSVLQVRIGSLLTREMGDVFNVSHSTLPPEAWLKRSAVIELESMGKYPANFLSLLLSTLIRETLKVQDYNKLPDGRPRHVMFFEEAHNLIGPTAEQSADGNTDTKTAATAFVVKMLAEVRALGEGIVIADQLPTAIAPEVIKNTSLKIGLRITAQDDRGLLGGTMSADEVQLERMGVFSPGHALCSYEPLLKPFEVQIPYFESKEDNAETVTIVRNLLSSPYYQEDLRQSLEIHRDGWKRQRYEIRKKYNEMLAKGRNSDPIGSKESAKKAQDVRAQRDEVVKKVQQVFLDVAAYGSMLQVVFHEAKVKPDLGECKTIFDNIKKTLKSEREIAWNQYNQIYKALEPTNLRITEEEDTALSIRAKAF